MHFLPNLKLFIPVIAISLYTTLNSILLGVMSTMEQTGYFDYSEKMAKMPLAVITALGTVMLPHMSGLFASGKHEEGLALLDTSMWFMLAGGLAVAFGIAGIAPEFVPGLFRSRLRTLCPRDGSSCLGSAPHLCDERNRSPVPAAHVP